MMVEDELFIDDDLAVLDIVDDGFPRAHGQRQHYFHSLDDLSFFRRFRLTKPTVEELLGEIQHELEYDNNLNNQLSPMNQLLTTLRFYASNGHQISIGDFMGIHQSTACRVINKVSRCIANLRPVHVKMPQNQNELLRTQEQFYHISHFPRVGGVIDCTQIKMQSPGGEDPEIFRNRKGNFALNVQVVGNSNMEIMDIVARWPGSTHDATIFNNSAILGRFQNGEFGNSILLGDSGYPLRPFCLTPLLNPQTRAEHLYNEALIRTRNVIERIFGNWKRRFPLLAYGLRCNVNNALPIIVVTSVLQNIARKMGEAGEPPAPEEMNAAMLYYLIDQGNVPNIPAVNNDPAAINYRRQLINDYFANLH